MRRIIFVGIHAKPGLPPLCSTTKTGKIIDAIIAEVAKPAQVPVFKAVKANLFTDQDAYKNSASMPAHRIGSSFVKEMKIMPWDILVLLGLDVQQFFTMHKAINLMHPGALRGTKSQKVTYIEYAICNIREAQAISVRHYKSVYEPVIGDIIFKKHGPEIFDGSKFASHVIDEVALVGDRPALSAAGRYEALKKISCSFFNHMHLASTLKAYSGNTEAVFEDWANSPEGREIIEKNFGIIKTA